MVGGLKPSEVVIDTPWNIARAAVWCAEGLWRRHAVNASGMLHVTVTGRVCHLSPPSLSWLSGTMCVLSRYAPADLDFTHSVPVRRIPDMTPHTAATLVRSEVVPGHEGTLRV
jgi:hypothetical protein